MKNELLHINLNQFKTKNGKVYNIPLSYQLFGQPLHTAPVILINHALTGNSDVTGKNGWWQTLVGEGKVIDTNRFTIICFNIPGNGFDGFFIDKYTDFTAHDIAEVFIKGLKSLKINKLFALVGGSVGGSIGWEMLVSANDLAEKFIPIATDFKTSDWLHSQCLVQKFLLDSPEKPLEKARIHAMLCYRTPESLNVRFNREVVAEKQILKSHDWLNFHGNRLNERFSLKAYKLVNHLLMNISGKENELENINAEIHLVSVDSDLFYPAFEIKNTYQFLQNKNKNVQYHEINSIHGHDAFLMEYEQLNAILKPIFNK
ncbi:homoserine O-acetyltransferase [Epilithonimonas bovis DSM 19482]|uniref:Homoserine O-acetyltransferase n=1 Tax=Epilithonimonas bovis DSM 19482 TaxID=1121284 RepID=A0A1U7PZC0_9FLAO|nr:alpha/beta fold hydrolase [Epilithonimonas bovis]SIT98117.1 homoserine O-acetyltransferase [Epilithonimonas bovis DSM 19482]